MREDLLKRKWDVIVAGAGPAGLFAALGIASQSDRKVLVLDAGSDIDLRQRAALQNPENPGDGTYLKGVGGAGLFSDGKLCLSLEVGGNLRGALSDSRKQQLVATIASCFGVPHQCYGELPDATDPVATSRREAETLGLRFKYYPVFHIGTDRCHGVIHALRQAILDRGVELLTSSELRTLSVLSKQEFHAKVIVNGNPFELTSREFVLALGKVGANAQSGLCRSLGLRLIRRSPYIGVRIETNSENLARLFEGAKDPKYSMEFPDGSKIKTHCASNGGQVLLLEYDGLPLVGGHSFCDLRTGRSSISLLWDGIRADHDSYQQATGLMSKISAYTGGLLLAQRAQDYLAGIPSTDASLVGLNPSNRLYKAGDVRDFLPREYFRKLDLFLGKLARLAPSLLAPETVFYAPAIEWWMDRVEVRNEHMETEIRGLYVCGDGSGWSQGIVHAAATGLLAAEGITGTVMQPASDVVHSVSAALKGECPFPLESQGEEGEGISL
jgi:uncharacterized protein